MDSYTWSLLAIAFLSISLITSVNGQNLAKTIHPETRESLMTTYDSAIRSKSIDPNETRLHADTIGTNIYFLSGLGADKRVFSNLKLDNQFPVKYIEWIRPLRKETLSHYAKRLSSQIDTTKPFQLVGLSFGGIVASELSDIVSPQKIIIISSTSTGVPVSRFYRGLIKVLLLHPLAAPILKSANSFTYKYFGADTPELKLLLKKILHDTDSKVLKWALIQMSSWERKTKAQNLYHIHGTADRLIPIRLVHPDAVIKDGGHLMVYKQHEEISALLNEQLQ